MAALPALTKTYSVRANAPFQANGTAMLMSQSLVFSLAQHMLDLMATGTVGGARHANSVWICKGSSDSVSVSLAGVNHWVAHTNCVFNSAGNAHSWIWLENATLGLQCVIDCVTLVGTSITVAFSRIANPFTGGTTTARPAVAASEFFCGGTSFVFISDQVTSQTNYTHYVTTDDGRFMFLTSRAALGVFTTFIAVLKSTGYVGGDTQNFFAFGSSSAGGRGSPSFASISGLAGCGHRNIDGSAPNAGGIQDTAVFGGTGWPGNKTVDVAGNYKAFPLKVSSFGTTTPLDVERGLIPDVQTVAKAMLGGSVPSAAAQERVIAGDFILPWPTVVPIV